MRKLTIFEIILSTLIFIFGVNKININNTSGGAPPYEAEDLNPPEDPLSWIINWTRPQVPVSVALQVGHWKNSELPQELERLHGNTGASGGNKSEWEVNLQIAEFTAKILREHNIEVDILPSTIPPGYWADVFVAIHADGNTDSSKRGFKLATPRRDYTQTADDLLGSIESEYQLATGFEIDPNVTRNMTGYYAFAWWRYEHALHPRTTSVILETGFLTSHLDRKILVDNPEISAQGLANGIIKYLIAQNLLPAASTAPAESSTAPS